MQHSQYYHQLYGTSSSTMPTPYYYGYSVQAPRGTFSTPQQAAHRMPGPSYLYYPTQMEGTSFTTYPPPHPTTRLHSLIPSPNTGTKSFLSLSLTLFIYLFIFICMVYDISHPDNKDRYRYSAIINKGIL